MHRRLVARRREVHRQGAPRLCSRRGRLLSRVTASRIARRARQILQAAQGLIFERPHELFHAGDAFELRVEGAVLLAEDLGERLEIRSSVPAVDGQPPAAGFRGAKQACSLEARGIAEEPGPLACLGISVREFRLAAIRGSKFPDAVVAHRTLYADPGAQERTRTSTP